MKNQLRGMPLIVNFYLIILICMLTIISCDQKNGAENDIDQTITKHALVIGVDGLRPDAVKVAYTPNLDALIANGAVSYDAYAGGELGKSTQQATSSGPSWSSILTGVWIDKHNVPDNSFKNPNYAKYPHFFKQIKEKKPTAYLSSIVHWKPINQFILSDADYEDSGNDAAVALKAVFHLGKNDPDVLFLHFDDVDGAGHSFGYGPEIQDYLAVVSKTDTLIGQVLRKIEGRPRAKYEDWLIIVVSDHGGIMTGHGGQTPEERFVFLLASGGATLKEEISPGPGIVAVPSTVFKHLDLPIEPTWGWEAPPFGFE